MKRKLIVILIALPLAAFLVQQIRYLVHVVGNLRAPQVFVLPDHYTGWVKIKLNDPTCPKSEIKNEKEHFHINVSGNLCTATDRIQGFSFDQFVYASQPFMNLVQNVKSGANWIWNDQLIETSAEGNHEKYFVFYVGAQKPNGPPP